MSVVWLWTVAVGWATAAIPIAVILVKAKALALKERETAWKPETKSVREPIDLGVCPFCGHGKVTAVVEYEQGRPWWQDP